MKSILLINCEKLSFLLIFGLVVCPTAGQADDTFNSCLAFHQSKECDYQQQSGNETSFFNVDAMAKTL